MPIGVSNYFNSEQARTISFAFEDVLSEIGLLDRTNPIVVIVAKRVVDFAKEGQIDRDRLRQLVVKSFRKCGLVE